MNLLKMTVQKGMALAALCLTLTLPLSLATAPALAVPTGSVAPDFTLTATDGKSYSLSQFKGKFVVLEWFNYKCPFVHKYYEGHAMPELQKKYTAQGVVWLMIDSTAPGQEGYLTAAQAREALAARKAQPTAFLLDPKGQVGHRYDVTNVLDMFVLSPEGKILYQGAIDNKPSTRLESIKTATPLFTNALDAALAHKPIAVSTTKSYGCSVKY